MTHYPEKQLTKPELGRHRDYGKDSSHACTTEKQMGLYVSRGKGKRSHKSKIAIKQKV